MSNCRYEDKKGNILNFKTSSEVTSYVGASMSILPFTGLTVSSIVGDSYQTTTIPLDPKDKDDLVKLFESWAEEARKINNE